MLVLSRKVGETLTIGNDIQITVLELKGNRVRLGIQAPADCRVLRGELTDLIAATVPQPSEVQVEAEVEPPEAEPARQVSYAVRSIRRARQAGAPAERPLRLSSQRRIRNERIARRQIIRAK